MIRITFVCLGNICRSPMAEFIFKKIASERGGSFDVDSAATSDEERGNPVYPPAAEMLRRHGIDCRGKRARRFDPKNYAGRDYIVCMESRNIRSMERMLGGDPEGKLSRLLDYTDNPGDIADPWYTGDFETAYREIYEGCQALYEEIVKGK